MERDTIHIPGMFWGWAPRPDTQYTKVNITTTSKNKYSHYFDFKLLVVEFIEESIESTAK